MGLPSSRFQPQLLLVKSPSTWNKRLNRFATMRGPKKGPKLDPPGGTTLISSGPLSDPFLKHVSFARGSKNGPSAGWIRCLLEGPVLSPPMHLLQLRCSNVETHQRHIELAIRASNSRARPSLWCVFSGVFGFVLVLWFLFVFAGPFSCLTPLFRHVGLCTGPRSLSTPQCGTYRTLNSFNGTNTVLQYDLARAEKRRMEKKRIISLSFCVATRLASYLRMWCEAYSTGEAPAGGLVLAACPTVKNGVAVTRDCETSAS